MEITEKIIEAFKASLENNEETLKSLLTIKGQINAMAHVQGMVVKSLALLDPRIGAFFLTNLESPRNVLQGTALDTGIFDEYIAWMRQLVGGENSGQAPPSRPQWLREVIDGGKSDISSAAPAEEEPPATQQRCPQKVSVCLVGGATAADADDVTTAGTKGDG